MKNSILILLLLGFTISCQTKAENIDNLNRTIKTLLSNPPAVSATPLKVTESNMVKKQSEVDLKIGNVESRKQGICLRIQNSNLKVSDKIQIVLPEKPQQILIAEIAAKTNCAYEPNVNLTGNTQSADLIGNNPEESLSSYLLKLSESDASKFGFGIAIVNVTSQIKMVKGLASVDIDGDGKDEYFRECASNEGLHLTVWKGKPLVGKRIWHSYYHFNYDTENDCKKKDYEEINN